MFFAQEKGRVRILLFVILVLIIISLACGCSSEYVIAGESTVSRTSQTVEVVVPQLPGYEISLSAEKQQGISDAWTDKYGKDYILNWDTYTRYYGTYGDSIVFINNGELAASVISEITVAGSVFKHGSAFTLNVYCDGEICDLGKAYENGLLTETQIAAIFERHAEYLKEKFGEDYYNTLYGESR